MIHTRQKENLLEAVLVPSYIHLVLWWVWVRNDETNINPEPRLFCCQHSLTCFIIMETPFRFIRESDFSPDYNHSHQEPKPSNCQPSLLLKLRLHSGPKALKNNIAFSHNYCPRFLRRWDRERRFRPVFGMILSLEEEEVKPVLMELREWSPYWGEYSAHSVL